MGKHTWYDPAGRVVKAATGQIYTGSAFAGHSLQKCAYDGLGRLVMTYVCYDLDETAYADADDVLGDTVVEQTQTFYDPAGNAVAAATYQRLPSDTTSTGALTAGSTNTSYVTAAATWYDGIGRAIATADYGREDVGSAFSHSFFNGSTGALIDTNSNGIPDVAEGNHPAAYASNGDAINDAYIVALTEYDDAGRAHRAIDNLGRVTATVYDDAGRVLKTIQNYNDGTATETETAQDLTTEYEYDSSGRLATMIAHNPKGFGGGVMPQKTKYLYTSEINASWQTGVLYPDTDDETQQNVQTKVWIISGDQGDHVSTAYDRLGRTTETTDQRGVVHAFSYDAAGRLDADTVTSLGSGGVDGSVRRVGTAYDDVGRVHFVTSYADTGGSTLVNQVKYEYDGWGNVEFEFQEHRPGFAVNNEWYDGSLYVRYYYDDNASGGISRYVRPYQMRYPDRPSTPGTNAGRLVSMSYGAPTSTDYVLSRVTFVSTTGASTRYTYLGAGGVVSEDEESPDIKLDYSLNDFAAWDRFGRVVDQVWTDYGENPDVTLDEFTYTYDRAGNVTAKDNVLNAALDEIYAYDDLDRLIDFDRTNGFDQSWTLDGSGNFGGFNDDGAIQTRSVSEANEITAITGGWISPTYDAAGNVTSAGRPGTETTRQHYAYDAWNHLVRVNADSGGSPGSVIATYSYDGLGRRIKKIVGNDGYHYFYNLDWQLIDQRQVNSLDVLQKIDQYVWSERYVDSPAFCLHDGNKDGDVSDSYPTDWRRYYLDDANHNVTTTIRTDASNNIPFDGKNRNVFAPYGEIIQLGANWTGPSSEINFDGPRYAGYMFDTETGLYNVRNRYYDSSLSLFVSRDPIGYRGGINLYEYVGDSPLTMVDPSGLDGSGGNWLDAYNDWKERSVNQCQANADKLRQKLSGCCSSLDDCKKAECEKELDAIIAGLKKACQNIYNRGGPSCFSFNGPVCTQCEEEVRTQMPSFPAGSFFDYGGVAHIGPTIPGTDISVPGTDHAWGEIKCKATGRVYTIDFWVGGPDFWRCGPDAFGWKRTSF